MICYDVYCVIFDNDIGVEGLVAIEVRMYRFRLAEHSGSSSIYDSFIVYSNLSYIGVVFVG